MHRNTAFRDGRVDCLESAVLSKLVFNLKRSGRLLVTDRRGNVLTLAALAMPCLIAMLGLGIESASWHETRRSAQNAADAAAVAAATNGSATYTAEALAVAAQYGFTNGTANTTVTASNVAACPTGGLTCYSVTITKVVPLSFSRIVGFQADTTIGGHAAISIASTAVAKQTSSPRAYCMVAKSSSGGIAFQTNGAPKADLAGCSVMSNSNMVCNGSNLNAVYGDAHGSNNGCGVTQESNVPVYVDAFVGLASSIPANPCSSYAQEPTSNKGAALSASNLISGTNSAGGNQIFCGDVQLTGNVTLTGADTTFVIENGQLDTNGYAIKTATGAAATLIFTGTNAAGYTSAPTGGGTIDLAAPTSGTWSGVAIYQDPALTNGVDISAAGNSPTWDITGLVYLPNANVTFSGAVNKSSNGRSCFAMIASTILINGTASILGQGQCAQAGLSMPSTQMPSRGQLVI